jgi:hypothetical protein
MAVPADTYLSYSVNGAKESFEDAIYNIAPTDTPFLSGLKRKSIDAKLHQWQTDTLAAAAANAQLEGDDTANEAQTATTLWSNYTQISKKVIQVSGSNMATDKYGRGKDELAYRLGVKGSELKNDMEFGLCQNTTFNAGAAGTARQSRGLEGWIYTNDVLGATGVSPVPASNTAGTDGTQRAFTEDLLREAQKLCFDQGGNPDILMVGTFNRGVVDSFTGFSTRMNDAKDKKIVATIEFYVGPFGKLKVVTNRFQRDRTAFLLDMDYWQLGVLRPMKTEALAKTGDSEKRHILTEYTLISKNEKASGAVRDLTTS